jgi:hypothetical protein
MGDSVRLAALSLLTMLVSGGLWPSLLLSACMP